VAFAYRSLRAHWAVAGAPSFPPLGADLIGFTGLRVVALCAAAATVALALRTAGWRWPLLALGWGVSTALVAACALLLLDVVGRLLPGLWLPFHPVAFCEPGRVPGWRPPGGAATVTSRRCPRSACLFCGRTGAGVRSPQPPRWAWWAAWAAVAGWLVRVPAYLVWGLGRGAAQLPTARSPELPWVCGR
jgi:hypothetical protein